MSEKNNGGSAFPHSASIERNRGMSLRDYFAAQAMQSILLAPLEQVAEHSPNETAGGYVARQAYKMADAMLKAREA